MKLSQRDVLHIVDLLGLKRRKRVKSNGWLDVLCPFHADKNFGSCSIETNTGVINCYSCGNTGHVFKLLMEQKNLTGKEAYALVTGNIFDRPERQDKEVPPAPKPKVTKFSYDFVTLPFDPTLYQYTVRRGCSKEWCQQHSVVLAVSGIYLDYMIVPIRDKATGIEMYEARKVMEYEYLQRYYNAPGASHERLKRAFKTDKDSITVPTPITEYLTGRKCLYPPHSRINEILFNLDNLDASQPVYLTEGLMSVPRVSQVYPNATCCFGSNISDFQLSLLKRFPQIVVIPDNDPSGWKMVEMLHVHFTGTGKVKVLPVLADDAFDEYSVELRDTEMISSDRYIKRKELEGCVWKRVNAKNKTLREQ